MKRLTIALALALLSTLLCAQAQLVELNIALNKPASGDTSFGAPPARGVDGIDGTENPGNWTHADYPASAVPYPGEVDLAPNPYWQVDLGEAFDLTRLELVDRVGCCDPNRLNGSTITLFDEEGEVVGEPIAVDGYSPSSPPDSATMEFDNGGLGWSGVASVRIDGDAANQYFQFSEFRAFSMQPPLPEQPENAALNRLVTASAETWSGLVPGNLTDGNLATLSHPLADFGTLGFTYTVDLGMSFNLEEIVLWGRAGCCPERLSNYRVSLLETEEGQAVWSADLRTDGSFPDDGGSDSITADLDPDGTFAGRFIVVENLSDGAYNPQIAELEALTFDEIPPPPPQPTAAFFTAEGVETRFWGGFLPTNAIDGNPNSFTHPLDQASTDYYLEVDLLEEVFVSEISLTGRLDGCCADRFTDMTMVFLDALLNETYSQVVAGEVVERQTIDLTATSPRARYIRIVNTAGAPYGPQVGEIELAAQAAPTSPFAITGISVTPATGMVSLTFNSSPGANYAVFASSSLEASLWEEVDDAVPSGGTETTYDFTDLEGVGQPTRLYRVERN